MHYFALVVAEIATFRRASLPSISASRAETRLTWPRGHFGRRFIYYDTCEALFHRGHLRRLRASASPYRPITEPIVSSRARAAEAT